MTPAAGDGHTGHGDADVWGRPQDGPGGDGPCPQPRAPDAERIAARALAGYLALIPAIALHLMVGALLPLSTAFGPPWLLVVSIVVWAAAAIVIWRWHRRRPIATLFVPFAVLGLWYGALQVSG